jgi:hypothetical protein
MPTLISLCAASEVGSEPRLLCAISPFKSTSCYRHSECHGDIWRMIRLSQIAVDHGETCSLEVLRMT